MTHPYAAQTTVPLTYSTVDEPRAFESLAPQWDALVLAARRPSPFLLHGWLAARWSVYGGEPGRELRVEAAFAGDRLAAAFPVEITPAGPGVRAARAMGAQHSALADVLVADDVPGPPAGELVQRALELGRADYLDVFGVAGDSVLRGALDEGAVTWIPRVEAPVLSFPDGWEETYRARTPGKRRNLHRRRRRQLEELGDLRVEVAREPEELAAALEDAFLVHDLRWRGRPDGSEFTTPLGRVFHRRAALALAADGVPRILTLRLDGRPIAFHYYFLLGGCMYVHRLAFDPALGRYSPGIVTTLLSIEAAAAEGARRVEFLGGGERYKLELADGTDPLYQCLGPARTARGRAAALLERGVVEARLRLKRSERLHRLYLEGLAPARRAVGRLRGR